MDRVPARILGELCVGHNLELTLPPDDFPADHYMHPFDGPRRVRVCNTSVENDIKQVCVYLLEMPLPVNDADLEFETATLNVFLPAHTRSNANWSLLRALHFSFPGLVHLKDVLPNAELSVVYPHTFVPVHTIVAARLSKRGGPVQEFLVQFTETEYENSAWIPEKFVPQRYLDEWLLRFEPEGPPAPVYT